MASLKTLLFLGTCLYRWIISTAENSFELRAENVHWLSLDFKTILIWKAEASNYTYSVLYSSDDIEWIDCLDCTEMSELKCDMTNHLIPFDRTYSADIRTEPATRTFNQNYDPEELPHVYSPQFNPYRESNISAVEFTLAAVDERTVSVNITDPLSGVHHHRTGEQLSIRDILKNDLKYKITYYKSGSTGKRDIISDSSMAQVSSLDAGQSYCFMVAAYIPSRPKASQQGAWSKQLCTRGDGNVLQELNVSTWVGAVFIVLTVLIVIVVVAVLCRRCRQQRNKRRQTSQHSSPI